MSHKIDGAKKKTRIENGVPWCRVCAIIMRVGFQLSNLSWYKLFGGNFSSSYLIMRLEVFQQIYLILFAYRNYDKSKRCCYTSVPLSHLTPNEWKSPSFGQFVAGHQRVWYWVSLLNVFASFFLSAAVVCTRIIILFLTSTLKPPKRRRPTAYGSAPINQSIKRI